MLIIFEGHDGSGKTTLSQLVSKHFNAKTFVGKHTKYIVQQNTEAISFSNNLLIEYITQFDDGKIKIFDRLHLTENVYSKVKSRKTNDEFNLETDEMLANISILFLCQKSNLDNIKDWFVNVEENKKVKELFLEEFEKSKIVNKFILDTDKTPEENIVQVINIINKIIGGEVNVFKNSNGH